MAAISAAETGAKTLLVEKGKKLGTKLAISGGGRCNVTNRLPEDEIIEHIPGNGKFLYSAFSIFNNYDIIDFFENLGVALKEEDHGRMFPVSNSAQSVVNTLIQRLDDLGVTVKKQTPVKAIHYDTECHTIILQNNKKITTKAVVIAVGGKSVPHTGSTGDGYAWAKKAGHTITDLYPTEVALTSKENFIREKTLQGLSLRDVAVSVLNRKGKPMVTHQMDMVFTHFGVSGPAILRCSQFVVKELMKGTGRVSLQIDLLPHLHEHILEEELTVALDENAKKSFKNILRERTVLPERIVQFILDTYEVDANLKAGDVSKELLLKVIQVIKYFTFYVHGSLPIEKAFVTGGGVDTKDIVPSTTGSKLMQRLF